jgi:hypothetical protein
VKVESRLTSISTGPRNWYCEHSKELSNSNPIWNPKFHFCFHRSTQLSPALIQMNPVHNFSSFSLRCILILSFQLHLDILSCLFYSVFSTNILYAFLISPMCVTFYTHLILLDLIKLTIFGEAYNKEFHNVYCSLLSLSPSQVRIFSSLLCSQTPSICILTVV